MAHLVVMYKTPKDAAAFDKHYSETHIPLAKKIPGLKKYEISQGPVATPARASSAAATPASRRSLLDHGQHPKRRVEINALSLQSRQRNDLRTPRAGPNCSLAR